MHQFKLLKEKACCFVLSLLLLTGQLFGQEDTLVSKDNIKANLKTVDTTRPAVYKINAFSTIVTSVAATAANMIAINNVLHNKKDLTPEEVNSARGDILSGFDRWALDLDPSKRDHYYTLSDHTLTVILAGSAATFIFGKKTRKD